MPTYVRPPYRQPDQWAYENTPAQSAAVAHLSANDVQSHLNLGYAQFLKRMQAEARASARMIEGMSQAERAAINDLLARKPDERTDAEWADQIAQQWSTLKD